MILLVSTKEFSKITANVTMGWTLECAEVTTLRRRTLQQIAKIPSFQNSSAWRFISVISLSFKLVTVLAWFPVMSS